MAIQNRRGNLVNLNKNKLLPGEFGITTDTGLLVYCYSPGNVKEVVTKDDVQNILDASPSAYSALQQLISDLESDPSESVNILSNINDINAQLVNKADKTYVDSIDTARQDDINNINTKQADNTKESILLSKFFWKLRNNVNVTIACKGDSLTYGSDFNSSNKRAASTTLTDDGTAHTATRASITYPEALQNYLNQVYGNIVTVINQGYSGDGTEKGYNHWNASGADLCIMNYGINDATNSNISYMGNVEVFLSWYRKLIERELRNNTAVILMKPTKQMIPVDGVGTYTRINVDVFANAVDILAEEYNLLTIDCQELLMNYSSNIYSDPTHLNGVGYNILGARIASNFIANGITDPYIVSNQGFQGAEPHIHNVIYNGGTFAISDYYPTNDGNLANSGTAAVISGSNKLYYSFYADCDGLVAIPTMYTASTDMVVKMSLDFGVQTADYDNDYNFGRALGSNTNLSLPSSYVNIPKSSFNSSGVYSASFMTSNIIPMLYITKKGWHTITIEMSSGSGNLTFHGIEYYFYTRIQDRFGSKTIQLTLENGATNFYTADGGQATAHKSLDGLVTINGVLNNIPATKPAKVSTLPVGFRPPMNTTFVTAIAASTAGGYAIVQVQSTGELNVIYISTGAAYCNINGITYMSA